MWNGKNFPPVGTVCEFKYFDDWQRGEVMQVTDTMCRVRLSKNSPDFVFTNPNNLRPIKAEWNGKGFPPVGTVCEFLHHGIWVTGKVVKSYPTSCMVENDTWGIHTENLHMLRPIKSAVEIGNEIHEQFDWNGEGFPPAGVKCEMRTSPHSWYEVVIVGMDDLGNCVARTDNEYTSSQLTEHFRPLRTERQIAQQEMVDISKANPEATLVELFGLIHDAGYTK